MSSDLKSSVEAAAAPSASTIGDQKLADFYAQHNVSLDRVLDGSKKSCFPHRFIRLNPRFDAKETLRLLKTEIPADSPYPVSVDWMHDRLAFYALPGGFSLSQSPCFRSGRVYGQDISSGAAVAALLSNDYDDDADKKAASSNDVTGSGDFRVLDMCCSPGLKLCAIADWLSGRSNASTDEQQQPCTVVGVDISEPRTALCKRIIQKYHMDPSTCSDGTSATCVDAKDRARIRLYCNDGTTFGQRDAEFPLNLIFDSTASAEEYLFQGKRKKMNKSARGRERKRLKLLVDVDQVPVEQVSSSSSPPDLSIQLFDRVLVDAECSTDGSLKHVQQRLLKKESKLQEANEASDSQLIPQLTDDQQLADLVQLQQRLAESGFRLLKPGGLMNYSTCSLSEEQNEGVVSWLLSKYPDARIVPLNFASKEVKQSGFVKQGSIPGTVRFVPNTESLGDEAQAIAQESLFGGGFFLAKIEKAGV